MTLWRDGATGVLGKYRYVKIGKDLKLQGILRGGDSLTIWEYDEKWNTTGIFTGRYTTRASDGAWESIEGVWTKPNNAGASLPFALRLRDGAPSAQITRKSLSASEVNGRYKRAGKNSAEINVQLLASGEVKIDGEAVWWASPEMPNLGDIAGVCKLQGNQAFYANINEQCKLTITFEKNSLTVAGDLSDGSCGGRNVSFNGVYKRVSAKPVFRSTIER